MKTKKEIIDYINQTYKADLGSKNTSYSKVNKSKDVWWFNIAVHKFVDDVHLLLNTEKKVIWIFLHKGFTKGQPFKIRLDKNAVDLEISADKSFKYLQDVKSGGTYFNFKPFVKETVDF